MRRSLTLCAGAVLVLLGLGVQGGCKQKEGDRCQFASDCDSPLFCCVKPAERAKGGVCALKCEQPSDVGVPFDGPKREASAPDRIKADNATPDKPATTPDKPATTPDKPAVTPDKPAVTPDTKAATPDVKTGQ